MSFYLMVLKVLTQVKFLPSQRDETQTPGGLNLKSRAYSLLTDTLWIIKLARRFSEDSCAFLMGNQRICNFKLQFNLWRRCSKSVEVRGLQSGRTCVKVGDSEEREGLWVITRLLSAQWRETQLHLFQPSPSLHLHQFLHFTNRGKMTASPWTEPEPDLPEGCASGDPCRHYIFLCSNIPSHQTWSLRNRCVLDPATRMASRDLTSLVT